jgi:hypothetical protein
MSRVAAAARVGADLVTVPHPDPRSDRPQNKRAVKLITLFAVALIVLSVPAAEAADRYDRKFQWSGYRWTVRSTEHRADPGNNRWGDSRRHVRVRRDGSLRLRIARGRSVDVVGPRTGYGRYRWIVRTDLSKADPFRVSAFFVHGRRAEQDVEFSRWGEPDSVNAGSWVTWFKRRRLDFRVFPVPSAPPYTLVIDWRSRKTRFVVRDATGLAALDTTVATHWGGRHIAPHISYWHYPGHGTSLSPYTADTVHPALIVESFAYRKLKRSR